MWITNWIWQEFPNGFKRVKHLKTIKDKTNEVFTYFGHDGKQIEVAVNCVSGNVLAPQGE